jgi:hypothetical protein
VEQAARMAGFDRSEAHMSRNPLRLDSQGWQELSKLVAELQTRAQEIEAESHARLKDADHEGEINVGLVLMLFEAANAGMPPVAEGASADRDSAPADGNGSRRTPAARG